MHWPGLEPTSYIIYVHVHLTFLNFTIKDNRYGERIVGANPKHKRNNLLPTHYFSLKNLKVQLADNLGVGGGELE